MNEELLNKYKNKMSQLDNSKDTSAQAASKSLNTTKSKDMRDASLENPRVGVHV